MTAQEKDFLLTLTYLFLQNQKYDRALLLLQVLQEVLPEDVGVRRSLSYALVELGQFEEGLVHAERVLHGARTPGEKQAGLLLISRALWGLGRGDDARRAYGEMRQIGQEVRLQWEAAQAGLSAVHGVGR